MIRAFFFLIKVGILVALGVWIAERPGTVSVDWMEYTLSVHVGAFLIALIMVMLLGMFIFSIMREIVRLPIYHRRRLQEKGYRALTRGLSAVAAGDQRTAAHHSTKARKWLPEDQGLPLLLEAQVARMEGQEKLAQTKLEALMDNRDTAFIGVRGLLQAALDKKDYSHALDLAREALKLHPKQGWILQIVYNLEVRARDWDSARKTLKRAERAKAIEAEKANSDRIAMTLIEGDAHLAAERRDEAFEAYKKALKLDPAFAPSVTRLVPQYIQRRRRNQAQKMIEKAWKMAPHPDLVKLWAMVPPKKRKEETMGHVRWMESLRDLNTDSAEGYLALAELEMEEGLWAEVRNNLLAAEKIAPSRRLYRMFAQLEDSTSQNEEAALRWVEKAEECDADPVWVCRETGRVYQSWAPIAEPHEGFNTIIWAAPDASAYLSENMRMVDTLLELPR